MFGRKRHDPQLSLQREFHANCVEQIEDLERRIIVESMAQLRTQFAAVWVDDQPTRELPDKVKLARRFATELGQTLVTSTESLASMNGALHQLQAIIDHCEHTMQNLLAGLMVRQGLTATGA